MPGILGGRTYSEGNVVQENIEACSSPRQLISDQPRHVLTLRNELGSIELRDYALEDFVNNGREHPLIEICSKRAIDLWESIDSRPRQDTACNIDHLKIFRAGQ